MDYNISPGRKAGIIESLQPLFTKARAEGLWFVSSYQECWFAPDELEAKHKEDLFLWGPLNWRLEDPEKMINQLKLKIEQAEVDRLQFENRVQLSKKFDPDNPLNWTDEQCKKWM